MGNGNDVIIMPPPYISSCKGYIADMCKHAPEGKEIDEGHLDMLCQSWFNEGHPDGSQNTYVTEAMMGFNRVSHELRIYGKQALCNAIWRPIPAPEPAPEKGDMRVMLIIGGIALSVLALGLLDGPLPIVDTAVAGLLTTYVLN